VKLAGAVRGIVSITGELINTQPVLVLLSRVIAPSAKIL
jgi:hypothetical protein